MEITDMKITKVEDKCLRAFVSVTFDNELAVHNIRIVEVDGKLLLSMPNKKSSSGEYKDYVHPINKEFRARLTEQIVSAYNSQS